MKTLLRRNWISTLTTAMIVAMSAAALVAQTTQPACGVAQSPTSCAAQPTLPKIVSLPAPKIVATCGASALAMAGDKPILLLQGTPYQMGYAYGRLLKDQVRQMTANVLKIATDTDVKEGKAAGATLDDIYRRTWSHVPERYKEEIAGLADGAGLPRHDVELVNGFPERFHCSLFALLKNRTADGKLLFGRVLDYQVGTSGMQNGAIVIVYRPTGRNAFMTASYVGLVGAITAMNDKQLAIGMMGMGGVGDWDGEPMTSIMRQIAEECSSLQQAKTLLSHAKRTCHFAYSVADAKTNDAFGAHTSPKFCEFFGLGESHANWPKPQKDTILISSGERYDALTSRVATKSTPYTLDDCIALITQPVAMACNLHNAIMVPEDGVMLYSNAAASSTVPNWQACWQPYCRYDLKACLAAMEPLAKASPATQPAMPKTARRIETSR